MSESTEKKSLLEKILDGAVDLVKRPLTVKRINNSFEAASNNLEETALANSQAINIANENLVKAAKDGSSLKDYIQKLIDLEQDRCNIERTEEYLNKVRKNLLEVK